MNVFRNSEKKAWIEDQQWFKDAHDGKGYNWDDLSDRIEILDILTNRRAKIYSGGPAKVGAIDEIAELLWGDGGGNIIGRNSFRPGYDDAWRVCL